VLEEEHQTLEVRQVALVDQAEVVLLHHQVVVQRLQEDQVLLDKVTQVDQDNTHRV
jgi:hypothetical protein